MKPKVVVLFTSYRCNSKCIMCHAWQKQESSSELSAAQVDKIFSNKELSSSVEIVNVTGGEPTLRGDLVEIIAAIVKRCKNLRRIDMPTNGINTSEVLDRIESILAMLLPTNVKLALTVSLDGVNGVHEQVRRVPGIFNKIEDTIKEIKEISAIWQELSFGVNVTINKLNYDKLRDVKKYGIDKGIGINYTLGAISEIGVESIKMQDQFILEGIGARKQIVDFFKEGILDNTINQRYGELIVELLKTGRRKPLCAFKAKKAILIEPDGKTYACGNFKDFYIGNLLDESFRAVSKNIKKIKNDKWDKCSTCESNCYIDEVLK